MKKQEIVVRTEAERTAAIRFIGVLSLEKPIRLTVEEVTKRRTLSQNALMWKWLNEVADKMAEYSGHTPEEIHDFFKRKFLSPTLVTIAGETVERYTTTKMNTAEMSAYMDRIYAFVTGECGIYLTLPEQAHAA